MDKVAAGETVYDEYGQEYEYLCAHGGAHILRTIRETDEGPVLGDPVELYRVFRKPPGDRFAQGAAQSRAELESALAELAEVQDQLRTIKAERDATLKRFGAHPVLQPVVDFLDGTITHVATVGNYGYGLKIQTVEEALAPAEHNARQNGEVRLLALYGGYAKGRGWNQDSLSWQLNRYRDGSGDNTTCILGTSEENVRERLQAFLDTAFPQRGVYNEGTLAGWADDAMKLGLRVPEALVAVVEKRREDILKNRRSQAERAIKDAENAAERARAELAALGAAP